MAHGNKLGDRSTYAGRLVATIVALIDDGIPLSRWPDLSTCDTESLITLLGLLHGRIFELLAYVLDDGMGAPADTWSLILNELDARRRKSRALEGLLAKAADTNHALYRGL